MERLLSDLEVGQSGTVANFKDDLVAGKLMTMGVLPGSLVQLIRKAPFKGGVYIKVDGCHIVLRDSEAAFIVLALNL